MKAVVDDGGVRVNRSEYTVDSDFSVEILNRGQPAHVTVDVKGEAAEHVGVKDEAVFVADSETVDVNVGVPDDSVEGVLQVSSGFDERGATVVLSLEPDVSGEEVLESDPAYRGKEEPGSGGEPRVDLIVAGVVGAALLAIVGFAALFGMWGLALVVAVVAMFGVAIMWLFKNYEHLGGPVEEDEGDAAD